MSGWIVERRDQVRITFFSFAVFIASTFTIRWASMKGPFFVERAMFSNSVLRVLDTTNLRRSAETWFCPCGTCSVLLRALLLPFSVVGSRLSVSRFLPRTDNQEPRTYLPLFRRWTINTSVRLLLRVL